MAEKRKRSQNFGSEEKERLVKLISFYKDNILNKRTDNYTNEAKNKAWEDVTNAFNASARVYRPRHSLVKVWEKIKRQSKNYCQTSRRSMCETGGGPVDIEIDPILEQACMVLGRTRTVVSTEVKNVQPNIIYEGGEKRVVSFENSTNPSIFGGKIHCGNTFANEEKLDEPRKRPKISQTYARSKVFHALYRSFQNINKKKECIHDLKRELLQDEIIFKRKLYALQLQAAEKEVQIKNIDVEIKTEILHHIKGGTVNLRHLFDEP